PRPVRAVTTRDRTLRRSPPRMPSPTPPSFWPAVRPVLHASLEESLGISRIDDECLEVEAIPVRIVLLGTFFAAVPSVLVGLVLRIRIDGVLGGPAMLEVEKVFTAL